MKITIPSFPLLLDERTGNNNLNFSLSLRIFYRDFHFVDNYEFNKILSGGLQNSWSQFPEPISHPVTNLDPVPWTGSGHSGASLDTWTGSGHSGASLDTWHQPEVDSWGNTGNKRFLNAH